MTAHAFAVAMARLGVNGPEDQRLEQDVDEWETINWRSCAEQVRRLRQRIFKATREGDWPKVRNLQKMSRSQHCTQRRPRGLLEPCAATSCTHGSEGAPAQQCAGATRRSRLGWGVLEDQRLRAVAGVDLAQRALLGATPVRAGRDRLYRAGQRFPRLR